MKGTFKKNYWTDGEYFYAKFDCIFILSSNMFTKMHFVKEIIIDSLRKCESALKELNIEQFPWSVPIWDA